MKKLQNFRKHSAILTQQVEENSTEHRRRGLSRAEEDGRERNGDSARRDTPKERGFGTVVESRIRFSGELLREREAMLRDGSGEAIHSSQTQRK
ncbi:hypothetical protein NPIL_400311 [Nephila pilipes]|uniref:Uncharacterized protein n=1 Tax=Nephila pilipes TaxID=299642 RepID=A0A8X6TD87_NEPPI|nr:hypothetical protein NPIL_400311 [Nephila pilipes]